MTEKAGAAPHARTVLQQCEHARLQVKPAEEGSEPEWVEINRGMVIYICFFKGATEDIIPKMVSSLLSLRLCEGDSGKRVSVLELPGSVLIVPQATLGGKAKSSAMQYHNNVSKDEGLRLYQDFVSQCERELASAGTERELASAGTKGELASAGTERELASAGTERELASAGSQGEAGNETTVKHGTYGNRQVLKLDTNGPYTHLMEF